MPNWVPLEFWTWTLGDLNYDHTCDIGDLTRMIDYLYISIEPISPYFIGDVDGNCVVDIGDLTKIIDYLYISTLPMEVGCE